MDHERDEPRERREAKLKAELEAVERHVRDVLDFVSDDRNLTDEGMAARETLRREIEAIEQDLEAVRQEHSRD